MENDIPKRPLESVSLEASAIPSMTVEELLALPVSFPLDTANRALALRRSTGYALARRDEYPVRVLRVGNTYRVCRSDLLRFLGIDSGSPIASPDSSARAA